MLVKHKCHGTKLRAMNHLISKVPVTGLIWRRFKEASNLISNLNQVIKNTETE